MNTWERTRMKKRQRVRRTAQRKYSGHGRIIKSLSSSPALYKYIWSLTEDIPFDGTPEEILKQRRKYHRFLAHLYASVRLQVISDKDYSRRQGYVPIYSRMIEQAFGRDFDVHILRDRGIIEIKGQNTARRRSREFRLSEKIYKKAIRIESDDILSSWADLCKGKDIAGWKTVDLMTGRSKSSVIKSKYTKDGGGRRNTNVPKVIRNSIRSLKPCPFNPKYIGKWVKALQEKYIRESSRKKKIEKKYGKNSREYRSGERKYLQAQGRYQNDRLSMTTILNQIPRKISIRSTKDEPLYKYKAAYSVQISGRLTEIHGGFQSASRYFKRTFFRNMQDRKKNYDLKSSQAYILSQEMKACNIECPWLESYLSAAKANDKYAKKIGISKDVWKECFYALIMGADAKGPYGAPSKNIKYHFEDNWEKTKKAHKKFYKTVKKLIKATEQWRDYVYNTRDKRYHYQHGKIKYWKNACGRHFKEYGIKEDAEGNPVLVNRDGKEIRSKREINECKRKLAAFILQGQESCYIHHLTIICSENGIPVYKNEHDGLITGKKIPQKLKKEAAKRSGLKNPTLKRKNLCSDDEREETRNYVKS